MTMTKSMAFELKRNRQRRAAAFHAPFREAGNDAPRCPSIHPGFEEPPRFPPAGGTREAGDLERRLRGIDGAAYARARGHRDV